MLEGVVSHIQLTGINALQIELFAGEFTIDFWPCPDYGISMAVAWWVHRIIARLSNSSMQSVDALYSLN